MPAWSYSSLTAFETCPLRYYVTRVTKEVAEPETEHTRWGNAVHKALELRVRDATPLPEGMTQYERIVAATEQWPGVAHAETQIALDVNFQPVSWFDKSVWVRGIVDFSKEQETQAIALDWKTGKPKSDSDQLKLFAGLLFCVKPVLQTIKTGFVWLAHGKLTQQVFTRKQTQQIWGAFLPRVDRLESAYAKKKWLPKPSGLCKRWCPVPRELCEFSERRTVE